MFEDETDDVQPDGTEPKGEPEQTDTAPTDAVAEPDNGEPAAQAARKYAGVYDSVEDFENGYKHVLGYTTKTAQENAALRRQLAQIEQERQTAAPAAADVPQGADLVGRLKAVYPDHPELHELAEHLAHVEKDISGQRRESVRQATQKTYSELQNIQHENADLVSDPATLQMFLAEVDERMPVKATYLDLVAFLDGGGVLDPEVAGDISKRVKAAFNAVRKETGRVKKTAAQTNRVVSRVDALPAAGAPAPKNPFNFKDDDDYDAMLAKLTGRKW